MFKLMVLEKRKRDKPKKVLGGKLSSVAQRSSERWPTSAWEREALGGGRSEIWWWGGGAVDGKEKRGDRGGMAGARFGANRNG